MAITANPASIPMRNFFMRTLLNENYCDLHHSVEGQKTPRRWESFHCPSGQCGSYRFIHSHHLQQFQCGYKYPYFVGTNGNPLEQAEYRETLSSQNDTCQTGNEDDRRRNKRINSISLKTI